MQACCYYSGARYIEKDKSINKSFLDKHFSVSATTEFRKMPHPFNSVRRPLPDIDVLYVIDGGETTELCSCECHINDPNIHVDH